MISVLPNNLSREPIELSMKISYKTLKEVLIETANIRNMPVDIFEDTYNISNGGLFSWGSKAIPCVAIRHTQHKKDYHCVILELKEAYGSYYAYIHMGGTSRNQRDINMGKSYNYIRSDGEINVHRPGWLGKAFSNGAEAKMQDESLYYDAVYKLIGSALAQAEHKTTYPPNQTAKQTHKQSPKTEHEKKKSQPTQNISNEVKKTDSNKKLQQSIGIETLGGEFTKLISSGTYLPTQKSMVFSTAEDKQASVEIHILQGESEKACDNTSLGKYTLSGIPPARRGTPQIEVTFSVSDSGDLNLTARDKTTNKELDIFVDNLLKANQTQKPQQPKTKDEVPTAVCPISISKSDENNLWTLDANVGFLIGSGVCSSVIERKTDVPFRKTLTLSILTDASGTVDIQVVESTGSSTKDNCVIGRFVLNNVPFSPKDELPIQFSLYVDSKGSMSVIAKNLVNGKHLPITFVPNRQRMHKMSEPKTNENENKSKVEQLKELADLLERGILSSEEFEAIKNSIIYK